MVTRAKLEMLGQRIGQHRDVTRALTQVPTGWDSSGCPTRHPAGHKAINPRGMGTVSPFQKSSPPKSKKRLTKGGESPSACSRLDETDRMGRRAGPGGPART